MWSGLGGENRYIMRIKHLTIDNFRGITHVDLDNLKDAIVVAGPNGSGKSSIFDAMRLWKSTYGSYGADEMQHWYNEHGLQQGSGKVIIALPKY